jgi:hypothetical protein
MNPARLPILELIALDLEQALKQVQTGRGWNSQLIVERAKGSGNPDQDQLVVIYQDNPTVIGTPQSHKTWRQPFLLRCVVVESALYDLPLDARINTMRADVEKAVRIDQQRGGLANNTIVGDPQLQPVQPISGFIVTVDIEYRTLIDDPYRQS